MSEVLMNPRRLAVVMFALGLALHPLSAGAQEGVGGIAGVVRDPSGAVLPGVTVEASSPALIEKIRTVTTDEQGRYGIVNLRPGIYMVKFSLFGFSTFGREGLEVTTGFTAPANAELKVGSIEETVTVTGASPVVDVQNVRTQNVLDRATMDTIPGARNFNGLGKLTVGASGGTNDVGGAR